MGMNSCFAHAHAVPRNQHDGNGPHRDTALLHMTRLPLSLRSLVVGSPTDGRNRGNVGSRLTTQSTEDVVDGMGCRLRKSSTANDSTHVSATWSPMGHADSAQYHYLKPRIVAPMDPRSL